MQDRQHQLADRATHRQADDDQAVEPIPVHPTDRAAVAADEVLSGAQDEAHRRGR